MSDEYTYRVCGVGPSATESTGTVEAGPPMTWTMPERTHRRSRRKKKRWPHAPTKLIPLPKSNVAFYRVVREPPPVTHTERPVSDNMSPKQRARAEAKARRRLRKDAGHE